MHHWFIILAQILSCEKLPNWSTEASQNACVAVHGSWIRGRRWLSGCLTTPGVKGQRSSHCFFGFPPPQTSPFLSHITETVLLLQPDNIWLTFGSVSCEPWFISTAAELEPEARFLAATSWRLRPPANIQIPYQLTEVSCLR